MLFFDSASASGSALPLLSSSLSDVDLALFVGLLLLFADELELTAARLDVEERLGALLALAEEDDSEELAGEEEAELALDERDGDELPDENEEEEAESEDEDDAEADDEAEDDEEESEESDEEEESEESDEEEESEESESEEVFSPSEEPFSSLRGSAANPTVIARRSEARSLELRLSAARSIFVSMASICCT